MSVPDGPVDTVEHQIITGARIMEGTWPSGETGVLIGATYPCDPVDANLQSKSGVLLIPIDVEEIPEVGE
jgi:hypothetical protein